MNTLSSPLSSFGHSNGEKTRTGPEPLSPGAPSKAEAHLLDVLQGAVVLGLGLLDLQQAAASLIILGHAHFLEETRDVSQDTATWTPRYPLPAMRPWLPAPHNRMTPSQYGYEMTEWAVRSQALPMICG